MNGQINLNSTEISSAISILSSSSSALEGDALSAINSDFAPLVSCGLFTSGLATLKSNIETIVTNEKNFISSLQSHLTQMETQENDISNYIGGYSSGYSSSGTSTSGGSTSTGTTSTYQESTTEEVTHGKKVSTEEITASVSGLKYETAKQLLEDIAAKAKEYNTTLTELLLNPEKSGLLYEILKKINGDTDGNIDTTSTDDTNNIQKTLLTQLAGLDNNPFAELTEKSILKCMKYLSEFAKSKGLTISELLFDDANAAKYMIALRNLYDGKALENYTPTQEEINAAKAYIDEIATSEGVTVDSLLSSTKNVGKLKKFTKTEIIKKTEEPQETTGQPQGTDSSTTVDVSSLPQAGENTSTWNTLNGEWVVPTTKVSVASYASYVASNKICQTNDTSKYGDKCLSFAETHAYAMYTGNTSDSADRASSYPHSGAFTSWFSDSKEETLKKIYEEVVNGKPVVIQVNGNKQGTSRHFVTVVGFKSSVTDVNKLTEQDLLIIDSWDGQTERMDTSTSRFLTTGAACHKNYTGYYLRILK